MLVSRRVLWVGREPCDPQGLCVLCSAARLRVLPYPTLLGSYLGKKLEELAHDYVLLSRAEHSQQSLVFTF